MKLCVNEYSLFLNLGQIFKNSSVQSNDEGIKGILDYAMPTFRLKFLD